jgi:hypothetical protein
MRGAFRLLLGLVLRTGNKENIFDAPILAQGF